MTNPLFDTVRHTPDAASLWDGSHKIPWNDPAFSARILREHLSQDHHLASRKSSVIEAQCAWIASRCLSGGPASILDLGCGPGLYSRLLAGDANYYIGLDFSPASIGYAQDTFGAPGKAEFRLADVAEADFGGPFELAMMLYGELNVFPPEVCQRILAKAHAALAPGGRLLIERQRFGAVRKSGQEPRSRTRADNGGLFSDRAYVCLTENHWFDAESVALQCFHVLAQGDAEPVTYRSTTRAWTGDEMEGLLRQAGFADVAHHDDWPVPDNGLALVSATK
ncbi:class I SAM-dependent methyltransferase [Pseudodesulfovibrio portus]|uniref:Methyltransferase n=1 Tax=Pseudodesulfovibrio portus TaxID=231439 RepID=A0ABM8AQR9_9BACT|nr:class I SAM-dependent methyltransferase [Pseudodesulfovibrio portus]BDQ33763.1 methyltransferase [Pseudodesulfovibrio portus]